jgi:hypothetical protein
VFRWVLSGAAVAGVVFAATAYVGGIDKEVILESPRSLQFRLMYWTGAIRMLQQHPLAGAGPGNFRQLYLQHKVDESSEEIRDPHNLFLDAWSSAGLVGLVGIVLLVGSLGRQLTGPVHDQLLSGQTTSRWNLRRTILAAVLGGICLQEGWNWINGQIYSSDDVNRLFLLTGGAILVALTQSRLRADASSAKAAAVALCVHLLAAGGFEMPGIMLLLLVCLALGTSMQEQAKFSDNTLDPHSPQRPAVIGRSSWCHLLGAAMMLAAAIVVLEFGLIPISNAQRHTAQGDDAFQRHRIASAAIASYRRAAESDPLSTPPRQRIAELESYRLMDVQSVATEEPTPKTETSPPKIDSRSVLESQLRNALEAAEAFILADVRSCFGYRIRARCLATGSILLKNEELLERAIMDQQNVTRMYPSSVVDWAELASLCDNAAGAQWSSVAAEAAVRALELEKINQQWGHRDQYLSPDQVIHLQRIAAQ